MPAISSSAPGKIILIGEHAVVFGVPAIAIPIREIFAKSLITPLINQPSGKICIRSNQIQLNCDKNSLSENHPIRYTIDLTLNHLKIQNSFPSFEIRISSTIPIAGGLGSGAAVSVSIVRSICAFLGQTISDSEVNDLVYQIEKIYHGNPSGIDNSVISFNTPIFFEREKEIIFLHLKSSLYLVIANCGIQSKTLEVIKFVNDMRIKKPTKIEELIRNIGRLAFEARSLLESGDLPRLGKIMIDNHSALIELGISTSTLNQMVESAICSGALGAKLTGAGMGGNIIALVEEKNAENVCNNLLKNGASNVFISHFNPAILGSTS